MSCCRWKRSENDALVDRHACKSYCGTCWQQWLYSGEQYKGLPDNRNTTEIGEQPPTDKFNVAREGDEQEDIVLISDDSSIHPLKKVTHTDGKKYLISKSRRLVFETIRYSGGKLKCVGDLTPPPEYNIKLFKVTAVSTTVKFPFEVSSEDHCETPRQAYDDLAPILEFVAHRLNKTRATLRIWDPYYCAGTVKRHLARNGFLNVHNECVDFYKLISLHSLPDHDVVITNPPYSTSPIDHIFELFDFLSRRKTPWFVLQPNYVYTKQFWTDITSSQIEAPRPFFLTPSTPRKYKYKTPCGLRHVANAQSLNTSPFVTFWYCWLGPSHTQFLYEWLVENSHTKKIELTLSCSEFFLPDAFKDSSDKTRRKVKKSKKNAITKSTHDPIEVVQNKIIKKKRR